MECETGVWLFGFDLEVGLETKPLLGEDEGRDL